MKLSSLLHSLRDKAAKEPISVGYLIDSLGERSHAFLIAIITLPFLQPIPLPGFSTPFGLAISIIGLWFALGKSPWLPHRFRTIIMKPDLLNSILKVTEKIFKYLEKFIRPRWAAILHKRWVHIVIGAALVANGLMLSLPLPIPFTNALPGWSLLMISLSLIEEDGVLLFFGGILTILSIAYLFSVALLPALALF